MRYLLVLFAFLSLPAWAGDAPAGCAAPVRVTWEQRFGKANVAHDGHLTLEEAKSGYADVARHFDDIDADHKGYVTVNDIRAWRVMRKAAHRLGKPSEDALRPRTAVERVVPPVSAIAVVGSGVSKP